MLKLLIAAYGGGIVASTLLYLTLLRQAVNKGIFVSFKDAIVDDKASIILSGILLWPLSLFTCIKGTIQQKQFPPHSIEGIGSLSRKSNKEDMSH